MSRGIKIALAAATFIVIAIVVLWDSNLGFVILRRMQRDINEHVKNYSDKSQVEQTFIQCTPPPGFTLAGYGYTKGVVMLLYSREDQRGLIQMWFTDDGLGPGESNVIQRRIQLLALNYVQENLLMSMQKVDEIQRTIRGQPVTLWIAQGTGFDRLPMRTMLGVFQAKRGSAMLLVWRTINDWDQDEMDAFLASIEWDQGKMGAFLASIE